MKLPGVIGNFGPGFDCISMALHDMGDEITIKAADEDHITIDGSDSIPTQWNENVAGVAIDALRLSLGIEQPVHVHIIKRMPGGSGLGSSASSAGGAVLAFNDLVGHQATPEQLVGAAGQGEAVASGGHFDDVGAVIQGGISMVRQEPDGFRLARIQPPPMHIAIALPAMSVPTSKMRAALPKEVPLVDAQRSIQRVAGLVNACHNNDLDALGECFQDGLVWPYRKHIVPFVEPARTAALEAGAKGAWMSGAGPAIAAICADKRTAEHVASSMADSLMAHDIMSEAFTAEPEMEVMHAISLSAL